MADRNIIFQRLKKPCVELSQAALGLATQRPDVGIVASRLEILKKTLSSIVRDATDLDSKLADYVFFPLSQVLKSSQKVSLSCLESTLECLAILIEKGWRADIQPALAAQMVILCTLMAERRPKNFTFSESTDELQIAALSCLNNIFVAAKTSSDVRVVLNGEANIPQMGQAISVVLDAIARSSSTNAQITAVRTLRALVEVADRELAASFLPGIVSRITKILKPSTSVRRHPQVLIGSVNLIGVLLELTLEDCQIPNQQEPGVNAGNESNNSIVDKQWIENARIHMKSALSSIVQLRSHTRDDVQQSICHLCQIVLSSCCKSLSNCSSLALETLIVVSAGKEDIESDATLMSIMHSNSSLVSLLQEILYERLQTLPTIMHSADWHKKQASLSHINCAYKVLMDMEVESSTLDNHLAAALRDVVLLTMQESTEPPTQPLLNSQSQSFDLGAPLAKESSHNFQTSLVRKRAQQDVLDQVVNLTKLLSKDATRTAFNAGLWRSLHASVGDAQVANFWLLSTTIRNGLESNDSVDQYMDFDDRELSLIDDELEDLYSFAIPLLAEEDDDYTDTRLQQLALRTLALKARQAGPDFRTELVDTLYPVLHALATPNEVLQQDSITTLNIFARACNYDSVQRLIVENVDYLTNAVALKLNSFSLSPQAPQVLLMMVRLAGSSLLPYLEDTVESIFAALEDYHGYPLLVEMLFKVLRVMAEEGVRARPLVITQHTSEVDDVLRDNWKPTSVGNVLEILRNRSPEHLTHEAREPHPQRPWGADVSTDSEAPATDDNFAKNEDRRELEEAGPPIPRTYDLLLKITDLTQYFLSSSSSSLSISLLGLVKTTIPAIARHENSFLPLINTLWPEISARLDDEEVVIQVGALDVIATLCEYAGDFMRSRIIELWPRIVQLYNLAIQELTDSVRPRTAPSNKRHLSPGVLPEDPFLKQALVRIQQSPAEFSNTFARRSWEALVKLLVQIADKIHLTPELFDEVLEMLAPVLDDTDIRRILEAKNADAVWLARYINGSIPAPELPKAPLGSTYVFAALV